MPQYNLSTSHLASAQLHFSAPPPGSFNFKVHEITLQRHHIEQCQARECPNMDLCKPRHFMRLTLNYNHSMAVPSENVLAVQFTPERGLTETYNSVSVQGKDVHQLLQHIDFGNPHQTHDIPGAIITGTLTVTYSGAGNQREVRTFRLLGASLLQDAMFPDIYYQASDGLQRCLEK
jgi:hypothetical protein